MGDNGKTSGEAFKFRCGREVRLCRLNRNTVRSILAPVGGLRAALDAAREAVARGDAHLVNDADVQLTNYAFGWGIADSPSEGERAELETLGHKTDRPHLARIAWVRFLLLADGEEGEEEGGELIGSVLLLTFAGGEERS